MSSLRFALAFLIATAPVITARTFEALPMKPSSSLRIPASAQKDTIEVDCGAHKESVELSTPHETVRIVGVNCPRDMQLTHREYKQQLHIFPSMEEGEVTSEFAYLKKGKNEFELVAGEKKMTLKVFRY